ncbi:unnamed protein product [Arctia plantaginis]|uniref:Peptidase aspartic putative domain-containing protein n=1 Tax=Arctia plantaginis TaxID=874455 RepID=A0A8S1BAF1_ARCPL|nr:unnamed protein product [Arctia plantaginis]
MLLGPDVYGNILRDGFYKCPSVSLLAQETIFGWILSGRNNKHNHTVDVISMHVPADDMLKAFWEMESDPQIEAKIVSEEEERLPRGVMKLGGILLDYILGISHLV